MGSAGPQWGTRGGRVAPDLNGEFQIVMGGAGPPSRNFRAGGAISDLHHQGKITKKIIRKNARKFVIKNIRKYANQNDKKSENISKNIKKILKNISFRMTPAVTSY